MKLLLFSYLHPDLAMYLTGRILYIDDAAVEMRQAPFAQEELKEVSEVADTLVSLTISETPLSVFRHELEQADCVYVASGETFRLLHALKSTGADQLLADAVRNGKLYAGSSAGAIGPDPRTVDTSGVSYAAVVSIAEDLVSKTSGATRLHQECRRRVL